MNFNDLISEVQDMNAQLESIRQEHLKTLREKFKSITSAFFEGAPQVQAVVWDQYTPYFNDGEPCEFSVNEPFFVTQNFDFNNLPSSSWEFEDEEYGEIGSVYFKPKEEEDNFELKMLCYEFSKIISDNEELMQEMFGDHVTVYLTKEKVLTEECSHD